MQPAGRLKGGRVIIPYRARPDQRDAVRRISAAASQGTGGRGVTVSAAVESLVDLGLDLYAVREFGLGERMDRLAERRGLSRRQVLERALDAGLRSIERSRA